MAATYTIYTYFNSEEIRGVLNAVVMLVGPGGTGSDYTSIVRVAGFIGIFLAVTYGFVKARGEDAAHYLIMMAIFYATLFTPRVTVWIEDHGGGHSPAPVNVDNVPLGLAFFASTTSHIGYWLTEQTETFFSLPSTSLKLGQNGLMSGARALREAQSAAIPDPVLAQDMINFMRDCINPELVISPVYVQSLLKSRNIYKDFGPSGLNLVNPGRMGTSIGTGLATDCNTLYTQLGTQLTPAATSEFGRIAQLLNPGVSAVMANTLFGALLPAAEGLMMTASASTAEAIQQRMMINVLNDTSANMAQIMNDPSASNAAIAQAIASSNATTSYSVMAKMAQETLPMIHNAIELVVLGIFPIVFLLIVIAGSRGGTVLRSYVMVMLWVQLWAPLYAIVNYVGTMAGAKSLKASLAGIDGISVSNAAALISSSVSTEAVAGLLTIAVPMIALAIVKGGEVAMSGVTSSLIGPATQAAQSAGAQVGSGNIAMGNTSWGTHSANTVNANSIGRDFSYRGGAYTTRDSSGKETTTFDNGTTVANDPVHRGAFSAQQSAGASSTLSQAAHKKLESAYGHSVAAGTLATGALQKIFGQSLTGGATNTIAASDTINSQGSEGVRSSEGTSSGTQTSYNAGRKEATGARATAKAGAGFGMAAEAGNAASEPEKDGKSPDQKSEGKAKLKGGFDIGLDAAKFALAEYSKAYAVGDSAAMNKAAEKMMDIAKSYQHGDTQANTRTGGKSHKDDISASLNEARTHLDQSQSALSDARAFTEEAKRARSTENNVGYNSANPDRMSAAEFRENGNAAAQGAKPLEEIRQGLYGDPAMPENHMSGAPALGEQGVRAWNTENNARPEVANTANAAYANYLKQVPPGSVGLDSLPLSKKHQLAVAAALDRIGTQAANDHYDGRATAERAENLATDRMGMPGVKPGNKGDMKPITVNTPVFSTVANLAMDLGAPLAHTVLSTPQMKEVLGKHGYKVDDFVRHSSSGGGFELTEQARGK